jgi:hypothetical protein
VKLPEPLRAYRARPLWWLLAGLAFTLLIAGWDVHDARVDHRWARTALLVEGEVREGYTGGAQIPVAYRNPVTDQQVELTIYTWGAPPDVDAGDPIALEVDPDDPEFVSVAGDRLPYFDPNNSLPWAAMALAWCGWRWWSVRRTARLAESDGPAFALLGAIAPASRFRRHPVLHLFALDAPVGARSLCSVRLLSTGGCPLAGPAFAVEVKGVPRPLGRVVARAPGTGAVLWSVGHAAGHRTWLRPDRVVDAVAPPPVPSDDVIPPRSRPGWWPPTLTPVTALLAALVGGVALGTAVTVVSVTRGAAYVPKPAGWVAAAGEVVERHDSSVDLRYMVDGVEHIQHAAALYPEDYTVGRRYPLTYDPDHPSEVRLSREDYDVAGPLWFAWMPAAAAAVGLTVAVRRSRRAWRLARVGPWSRLDLWHTPAGESHLGHAAADYVRAVMPPRRRRPFTRLDGPELKPGVVMVAGVPEPREVAAVRDAEGTVVAVSRRLRVPQAAAMVPPAAARIWPAYVIRGARSWLLPAAMGWPFLVVLPGLLGAVAPGSGFLAFVLAAGALVAGLCRIRMVVDADGIAVCDGLGTRRVPWTDVEHVRDGHHRPPWRDLGGGPSCLEITVRGEVEPLRPRATIRTSAKALQPHLAVIRRYAPAGTRVSQWDDGGVWAAG